DGSSDVCSSDLRLGAVAVQRGTRGDGRVRDRDAVELLADGALAVLVLGVDLDPDAGRRLGPLPLEMLRRAHDGDRRDDAALHQLAGEPERERGLTGARSEEHTS